VWVKKSGFHHDVRDKFRSAFISSSALSTPCDLLVRRTANDVDGVVLSTLRVNNLKSDIGIESYGVRVKIHNAIQELFPGGECSPTLRFSSLSVRNVHVSVARSLLVLSPYRALAPYSLYLPIVFAAFLSLLSLSVRIFVPNRHSVTLRWLVLPTPQAPLGPTSENEHLTNVISLLESFKPSIRDYLTKRPTLGFWKPTNVPQPVQDHIVSLKIPSLSGKPYPNLLLHNLGQPSHDKQLLNRVSELFSGSRLKQVTFQSDLDP
jgi:hypothetical protein